MRRLTFSFPISRIAITDNITLIDGKDVTNRIDASNQTDGDVITLLQLMESMFELGFLDVFDMRWRVATKTFRKKGE